MCRSFTIAVLLVVLGACKDDPPAERGPEPMRVPIGNTASTGGAPPSAPVKADSAEAGEQHEAAEPSAPLPERPPADPEIERTLELISASGLRFIDQPSEPDGRPGEYTAEQFAAMLRSKWDWIGYDLTEFEPWLDAIATRSFKTNLPYQVVLANGTVSELRPWLDSQLRGSE